MLPLDHTNGCQQHKYFIKSENSQKAPKWLNIAKKLSSCWHLYEVFDTMELCNTVQNTLACAHHLLLASCTDDLCWRSRVSPCCCRPRSDDNPRPDPGCLGDPASSYYALKSVRITGFHWLRIKKTRTKAQSQSRRLLLLWSSGLT